jgi:hypothetical protein
MTFMKLMRGGTIFGLLFGWGIGDVAIYKD